MGDLIQNVTNGIIEQTRSSSQETTNNGLGKDAFLKLLVTQMQYQDPLNPNTDTEFIAQLATFSQLEELQNIGALSTNSQALNLVGKNVVVKTEDSTGKVGMVSGKVDFVNISGGKAQLSIAGELYSIEQLDTVIDDEYIFMQGLPGIKEKIVLEFDGENPEDLVFTVDMGKESTSADAVAIVLDGQLIDQEFVQVTEGKVTISKEAFVNRDNGVYNLTVIFNDPFLTKVDDMVTLQVKNFNEFI